MDRKERIFLTGFMGSGKSTIGPILANTLGYEFVDLDNTIEERQGMSVKRIFQEFGEEHFRRLERSMVNELVEKKHLVVSLGGGTMVDPSNFRVIIMSGVVVYLKVTPEQIFKRLHHKLDRPILTDIRGDRLSSDELRARIQELFLRREPFYLKADITVPTDDERVGITVDRIVKKLSFFIG
jgi:shikimate kinase